uniref:Bm1523, isoform b n=1 Tax=Brugia malayi TaxID=6279 RepID=A0A1I9G578_BRUMA|nr:Bm1523, isoform b [Brugia malayi]
MDQTSFYQIHNDLNEMYVVLIKRSIEFQQFARSTVEKLPKIYQEIENDVKFKINDTIAAVQDQTAIPGNLNFHRFFMTFSWGTIMLIGYYFMYFQGSTILPLLLDFIFDTLSAILLAYIIIPAVLYFNLSKYDEYSRKSRFILLVASLFQGLLVGFLLSNCSTVLVLPVEIINMLFVSVISRILGHKLNNDRQTYFGIVNGTGFIFLVIIGYITRQLTKAYLFSTASAVLTSHLIIQIYMRRVMQFDLLPSYMLLLMITLSIYCQTLVRLLFGQYVQIVRKH